MINTEQLFAPFTIFAFSPKACAGGGDSVPQPVQRTQRVTTLRGVGQDKRASFCERAATTQPVTRKRMAHTRRMGSIIPRSQILLLHKSSSILAKNLLIIQLTCCYDYALDYAP